MIEQEPAVMQIETRGEEVTEYVAKANVELDGALEKARAARRKKWWCLGIVGEVICFCSIPGLETNQISSSCDPHHCRRCGVGHEAWRKQQGTNYRIDPLPT